MITLIFIRTILKFKIIIKQLERTEKKSKKFRLVIFDGRLHRGNGRDIVLSCRPLQDEIRLVDYQV